MFFNEEKKKKPITNQPVWFLIEGSLSPKSSLWYLTNGFLLYKIIRCLIQQKVLSIIVELGKDRCKALEMRELNDMERSTRNVLSA